jgi:hypothetical protein
MTPAGGEALCREVPPHASLPPEPVGRLANARPGKALLSARFRGEAKPTDGEQRAQAKREAGKN